MLRVKKLSRYGTFYVFIEYFNQTEYNEYKLNQIDRVKYWRQLLIKKI